MMAKANYQISDSWLRVSRRPWEPAYANLVSVTDELNQVIAVLESFGKSAPLFIH
jgi:hypothetical protein